ncbi:hypothetical protein T492DRAFT_1021302 [Pavlovales sp. CCMP2436]|nr:hypothetical protein T492DRAFT_1021302 [Pavlovales sp. CCMP2436]
MLAPKLKRLSRMSLSSDATLESIQRQMVFPGDDTPSASLHKRADPRNFIGLPRQSRVHPDDADDESPPTTPRTTAGSLARIQALDRWASSLSLSRLEALWSRPAPGGATTGKGRDGWGKGGGCCSRVSFEPSQATKLLRGEQSSAALSDSGSSSQHAPAVATASRPEPSADAGCAGESVDIPAVVPADVATASEYRGRAQGQRVLPLTTGGQGSTSTLMLNGRRTRTRIDMQSRLAARPSPSTVNTTDSLWSNYGQGGGGSLLGQRTRTRVAMKSLLAVTAAAQGHHTPPGATAPPSVGADQTPAEPA